MNNRKNAVSYADVQWVAEDVKAIRPSWGLARCEEELGGIENHLRDRTIELGWEVMDELLPPGTN